MNDEKNNANNLRTSSQPLTPSSGPPAGQLTQTAPQNIATGASNQSAIQSNMGQPPQNTGNASMGQYPVGQMVPLIAKPPMDSAKKRKIILTISVISGAIVLVIIAIIVIIVLSKVNYGSAYRTAKQLRPKIYDIYQSYDCKDVVRNVNSAYTSISSYNDNIEGCKKLFSAETDNLVSELGSSDAVKRNDEIRAHFDRFKAEYTTVSAGNTEGLANKLELWKAWHSFVVTQDDLTNRSSDAEFTTAANYLISSGSETLKTFGEIWLQKTVEVAAAYRAYDIASYSDSDYSAKRNRYSELRSQRNDWIATNQPDINALAPLNFNDASKMYTEFNDLYKAVKETYQRNYDQGSGDCDTFLGEVYCD